MIFVWDAITATKINFMTLPTGSRSVTALSMNSNGKYLVAADMSDDFNLHLFDLTKTNKDGQCIKIATVGKDKKQIFGIKWNPKVPDSFVTAGTRHLFFWDVKAPEGD